MNRADDVDDALIILTRVPRPGRVKNRLAARLGPELASESYRLMAERLFRESERLPLSVARYLFYDEPRERAAVRSWAGGGFHYVPQNEGDFGSRMLEAFRTVFHEGARKAVIVGSDVPDLSADIILEAYHLLDRYPAVIGPDYWGGYYLLGLKMIHPDLFLRNLHWGTSRVYRHTLQIMTGLGLTPAFLPRLIDVDMEGDLQHWLRRQGDDAHPLAAYLRQMGWE